MLCVKTVNYSLPYEYIGPTYAIGVLRRILLYPALFSHVLEPENAPCIRAAGLRMHAVAADALFAAAVAVVVDQ